MKTMALFIPKANPDKTFEDIVCSDKKLRLIYYKESLSGINLFFYKIKIRKLIKNCEIFQDSFSSSIKGHKIYRSGHSLVLFHIVPILKMLSHGENITVFSSNPDDVNLLAPLLMSFKNIGFVTTPSAENIYSEKLLEEFGITGAVTTNVKVFGKSVVIMPGCEGILPEGATSILNLSKHKIPWKSLSPENISFKAPKPFGSVSHLIRRADVMETVLNFFEMDFSLTKPVSVKFNKRKH